MTDSTLAPPITSTHTSPAESPSDERTGRSHHVKDPFFEPVTSRSASRDPNYQKHDQTNNIMNQVRAAQASTFAGQTDEAIRQSRSQSRSRNVETGSTATSQSRSVSRIRAMIKSIANDPFFHRPSKEEAAHQSEQLHQIILDEVAAAQASTLAGEADREARSRSRSRARGAEVSSQPGSRSQSRVRSAVHGLLGGHKHEETVQE